MFEKSKTENGNQSFLVEFINAMSEMYYQNLNAFCSLGSKTIIEGKQKGLSLRGAKSIIMTHKNKTQMY